MTLETAFQSTPTPKGRRHSASGPSSWSPPGFNPRPPRRAGDTSSAATRNAKSAGFQSTPTPKGRRHRRCCTRSPPGPGFNPRPPRRAGDTTGSRPASPTRPVSIHAHPEGQATRPRGGGGVSGARFNPRPPRRAGDTRVQLWPVTLSAFQSTPTPKGRRHDRGCVGRGALAWFQSTPTPKGRRHPAGRRPRRGRPVSIHAHPEGQATPFGPTWPAPCRPRFNPRPPRRAGDTSSSPTLYSDRPRFNPRPPRRAGDTCKPHRVGITNRFQSTPTPKGRRHSPFIAVNRPVPRFQSTPTPKGRRHVRDDPSLTPAQVSIHAHPEGQATRGFRPSAGRPPRFNPTPTPKGRRHSKLFRAFKFSSFQSTPTPKGRRHSRPPRAPDWPKPVSIHAHPEGQATLACVGAVGAVGRDVSIHAHPEGQATPGRWSSRRGPAGFNPRPPRRAGDTTAASGVRGRAAVSIHAHPEGQADTPEPPHAGPRRPRFNPRPPRRAGDTPAGVLAVGDALVSIHAHPEGQATRSNSSKTSRRSSFNPRPPRRAGDTRQALPGLADERRVSIHAHPEGQATRSCASVRCRIRRFNPRPPRRAGDTGRPRGRAGPPPRFNPRPPRRAGDTRVGRRNDVGATFQSTPTPKGRRHRLATPQAPSAGRFNPRPPRRAGDTCAGLCEG